MGEMANKVYQRESHSTTCTQNLRGLKHKLEMQLFFEFRPLKHIATEIPDPLPQRKNGNVFIIVVSVRLSTMEFANAAYKKTATNIRNAFLDHWTVP